MAVDLSAAQRASLADLQDRLRSECSGWRWVSAAGIHLTVRFLGEVDEGLDREARAGWRAAAASVPGFGIRLDRIGRFPSSGRPRVLWVGIRDDPAGAAADLAAAVEGAARASGFASENRAFRPHLTLARAARGQPQRAPGEVAFDAPAPSAVTELTLFRSELHPGGARYAVLERYPLAVQEDPK